MKVLSRRLMCAVRARGTLEAATNEEVGSYGEGGREGRCRVARPRNS